MKLEAKLEFGSISPAKKQLNHLLIRLKTPQAVETTRQPLVIGLAIDKSWSMKGQKMDSTIEAASYLVNWLTRYDYISIVAYSADVQIVQSMVKLSEKATIVEKLRAIQVGTSTNLSGGWLQTLRSIEAANIKDAYKRVILLTDGQATIGIKDTNQLKQIAADHLTRNISTTTVGFGDDFNEDALRGIAVAGGGNFYFIDNPEQAPDIFFQEFGDIGALYGQATEIKVKFDPGVRFAGMQNDIGYSIDGDTLTIQAGDIRSDDQRNFIVSIETEPGIKQGENIISIETSFYNLTQKMEFQKLSTGIKANMSDKAQESDPDVLVEILVAQSAKAMIEASKLISAKDTVGAKEIITNMLKKVENNLRLSPEVLGTIVNRLTNMEAKLKDNSSNIGKQLMAGGSDLYTRRFEVQEVEGVDLHDRIFEYKVPDDISFRLKDG
ncbi:MAG: VWA domain-containing protein [Leptospira sp.]|nr:VWA domain-containing protein [Leptospira sp.]